MRNYTDADREAAKAARSARRMAEPAEPRHERAPGRLLLEVNGQRFDLLLEPDPRDVRRWKAYRDGEPFVRGGLERIWRKVQQGVAPALGRRNL